MRSNCAKNRPAEAAERADEGIYFKPFCFGFNGFDAQPVVVDAADGLVEMELYAFFQTELVQVLGEEVAVAGRIRRQVQAGRQFWR